MSASLHPPHDPLQALETALQDERRALLERDAEALLRSTQCKLSALRDAEAAALPPEAAPRVQALAALNRANGVLLARRRREVGWALRHLGRAESAAVYDAGGRSAVRPQARSLGTG